MTAAFTVELLLSLAVKSALMVAGAAAVVKSSRRESAGTKHMVWAARMPERWWKSRRVCTPRTVRRKEDSPWVEYQNWKVV